MLVGVGFGIWNLLYSLLHPLAEDTIPALLMFYGPMFTMWAVTAFVAARKTGQAAFKILVATIIGALTGVIGGFLGSSHQRDDGGTRDGTWMTYCLLEGPHMTAYVLTTGTVFGLLTLAHVWRIVEEGSHLATDPVFVLVTLASGALCLWAWRVFRLSTRR